MSVAIVTLHPRNLDLEAQQGRRVRKVPAESRDNGALQDPKALKALHSRDLQGRRERKDPKEASVLQEPRDRQEPWAIRDLRGLQALRV